MPILRRLVLCVAILPAAADPLAAACSAACEAPPADCAVLQPTLAPIETLAPVSSCFLVKAGTYNYSNVNVISGGALYFVDDGGEIQFNVKSLLVQQGGRVKAGSPCCPFGSAGGRLTIGLWGDDPTKQGTISDPKDTGIGCIGQCYPAARLGKCCRKVEGTKFYPTDPCQATCASDHSDDNSLFEAYQPLAFDPNYFGYKVLAVSYGGSLEIFGAKGVAPEYFTDPDVRQTTCPTPPGQAQYQAQAWADLSGFSWARLDATANKGEQKIQLDRPVDWQAGDQLVVATTDWNASHSELVTVAGNDGKGGVTLTGGLGFSHYGELYRVSPALTQETGNLNTEVDVRAAVGLLSRSIVIQSLFSHPDEPFPEASECTADKPGCYFGGQVMALQGFAKFQLQGVELRNLGQGGRMMHYPIHFSQAKSTAYTNAFVKDSSIWDSNNRFVTVHATHEVTLARNVGFLSLGHGYYIEDGSEISNLMCQNLGVTSRPSIAEYFAAQSPSSPTARYIPPILDDYIGAAPGQGGEALSPSLFWIMNAYNEFVGNKAVGVGGFGSCYWLVPSSVSGMSQSMQWARGGTTPVAPAYQSYSPKDYAYFNFAGGQNAPLLRFRGNSCSTAPYALLTDLQALAPPPPSTGITPVASPYTLPASCNGQPCLPIVNNELNATRYAAAGTSATFNPSCVQGATDEQGLLGNLTYCVTTVLDRFTTSFNWAQANFGSIWLRPWNFAFINGAVTDQLFGGLSFVSGGSWNQTLPGYLAVTHDSIFAGRTQHGSQAGRKGPDLSQATCVTCNCNTTPCPATCPTTAMPYCFLPPDGVGIFTGGIQPARLINIYDGPFFSSGSIFTHIDPFDCDLTLADCGIYLSTDQPTSADGKRMKVIDAAIGWKQPNGFYYPPAFSFVRTGFAERTQRHNVVDPSYPSYWQGSVVPGAQLVTQAPLALGGITPIDFSTILDDLDGSLNGVVPDGSASTRTTALSNSSYFDVPNQEPQCNSFGTQTQAIDYVTTAVAELAALPTQASAGTTVDSGWAGAPAVPIYRQYMTSNALESCNGTSTGGPSTVCKGSGLGCPRATFMFGTQIGEAPYLTADQGLYYIDTDSGNSNTCFTSAPATTGFESGSTYGLYHLYASSRTKVTYQIYVGTSTCTPPSPPNPNIAWIRIFPHLSPSGGNDFNVEYSSVPLGTWSCDSNGILTVTLDNSTVAGEYFDFLMQPGSCQPRDICQPGPANACVRNPGFPEPDLAAALDEICGFWVTRRYRESADGVYLSDCPPGGCIGLAFQLSGFSAQPYASVGQPLATSYPSGPPWNVTLKAIDPECGSNK